MSQGLKERSQKYFKLNGDTYYYYSLKTLQEQGFDIQHLPYSIRVLLESVLRQCDGSKITEEHIRHLANWTKNDIKEAQVPFKPYRVILQDFTGVPAIVDLACLRQAISSAGGDATKINPETKVDLVIDHSVQVDYYGDESALNQNVKMEFERNKERYQFLCWAKEVFSNFNIVPPATGIVHQLNLEYLAQVVVKETVVDKIVVFPDTLVGTDSHTTMINGIGILGWGVGGIEAEARMLGQPSYFPIPEVIGVRLVGSLPENATATDLALRITQLLRHRGVVDKFVEFFGEGIKELPVADRATIANMAPEYGATCGFFPVDDETLDYLRISGRSAEHIELVKVYLKENDMFYMQEAEQPHYTDVIELDLLTIQPSLSGPKRPQDLVFLSQLKEEFVKSVTAPLGNQGYGLPREEFKKEVEVILSDGIKNTLKTGSLAIAAITSCTNTSNPYVMIGAGLLARNAIEKGLKVPAYVKTSLAPGSKVVTHYLELSGLQNDLDNLGFNTVGYGCTTCIGNSGPLLAQVEDAIRGNNLLVTSILSGNRNFEGRIHELVKANYLASPLLVIAYALAGTMNIDLLNEPLGKDKQGSDVYLSDVWPTPQEIKDIMKKEIKPELFYKAYHNIYKDNKVWNAIEAGDNPLYHFNKFSTYIQNPTFFSHLSKDPHIIKPLVDLRVIGKFKDSVTTDHISPAGAIGRHTPAGKYLIEQGVQPSDFNTYGSRRGNHEVMMRGTFANIRIRNQIAPGTEGGVTTFWPTNEIMAIYDACMKYKEKNIGLLILAGKDYGMGSSRDWAAKGTSLLGIKIVIAESYERIHRANLVMMGVLPLQFVDGQSADSLGLNGEESFAVEINETVKPYDIINIIAATKEGRITKFSVLVRFDSTEEINYYHHGGILQMILRQKLMD